MFLGGVSVMPSQEDHIYSLPETQTPKFTTSHQPYSVEWVCGRGVVPEDLTWTGGAARSS